MGDIVIPIMFWGTIIGVPAWVLWSVFGARTRGSWDAQNILRGQASARHWGYKEFTEEPTKFLLGTEAGELWRIGKCDVGVRLLTSRREPHFKACVVHRSDSDVGPDSRTFLTVEVPQRSDGAVADFAETLISRDGISTIDGEAFKERIGDGVVTLLTKMPELDSVYFLGETITFESDPAQEDTLGLVEALLAASSRIIRALPANAWVLN